MSKRKKKVTRIDPADLVSAHGLIELDGLKHLAGNPHTADRAALRDSIETFGQFESIVVWRGEILIGNNRVAVAREMGESHLAGYDLSDFKLSEAERVGRALASNRIAQLGTDDPELLALQLVKLDESLAGSAGFDLEALPVGVDEAFAALTGQLLDGVDPDEVDPVPPAKPVSKVGDVWQMGDHRLVVGDGRDPEVRSKLFDGDGPVGLLVTDPPYGVSYVEGLKDTKHRKIENDALDEAAVKELWVDTWRWVAGVVRPGASFYATGPGQGTLGLAFLTSFAEGGLEVRHTLIWVKDRFVLGRSDYHYQHEPILAGSFDEAPEQFVDWIPLVYGWQPDGSHLWRGERNKSTVWEIPRPSASADHPTTKPVELYGRALRNSSNPGDLCLDPFAGSGTMLAACVVEHRVARLVELDLGYADVIARRYQQLTGSVPHRNGKPHRFEV